MGRKNRRKKSAVSRRLKINPKKLISKPNNNPTIHSETIPARGHGWGAELGSHPWISIQEGCRPVVIMSNDTANQYSETVMVVPMTSKMKNNVGRAEKRLPVLRVEDGNGDRQEHAPD